MHARNGAPAFYATSVYIYFQVRLIPDQSSDGHFFAKLKLGVVCMMYTLYKYCTTPQTYFSH